MGSLERSVQDDILVLTLNRPQAHNALDRDVVSELLDTVEELAQPTNVRALVLTGAGSDSFSAGADMRFMSGLEETELQRFLARVRRVFRLLASLPIPTLAAVNGHAHGGGAELACCCDLRVGSAMATFCFPGVRYGMAVGSWHLATVVGLPKAKELLFTGMEIDSEEALRLGLLNRVSTSAGPLEESLELAREIAAHPPATVSAIKGLLDQGVGTPLMQRFYRELYSNRERSVGSSAQTAFQEWTDARGGDEEG